MEQCGWGSTPEPAHLIIASLVQADNDGIAPVPVEDALQQFNDLTTSKFSRTASSADGDDPVAVHAWHALTCLIEVASCTPPERHGKLVAFLKGLTAVELANPFTGEKSYRYQFQGDNLAYWKDLPMFNTVLTSSLNLINTYDPANTVDECHRWETAMSFFAQLSAAVANPDSPSAALSPIDLSFLAPRVFRWASEPYPLWPESESEDEDSDKGGHEEEPQKQPVGFRQPTECAVRGACMWLLYAADKLWANIKHGRVAVGWPEEDQIMTREDWAHWQRILEGKRNAFSDGTKDLIKMALERAKKAEGNEISNLH